MDTDAQPTAEPLTLDAIKLLKRMLNATGYDRLRWGPPQAWCPNSAEAGRMQALLNEGLVCQRPPTAWGAIYYFPTAEAHDLFGLKCKEPK